MSTRVKKSVEPSELEMQVLGILWERGPCTARQVLDNLRDGKTRAYTTILTVMQVMHRKGLISRMPGEGLAHVYKHAVTRKQVFKPFFGKLVSKVFGDAAGSSLATKTAFGLSALADELCGRLGDEVDQAAW